MTVSPAHARPRTPRPVAADAPGFMPLDEGPDAVRDRGRISGKTWFRQKVGVEVGTYCGKSAVFWGRRPGRARCW